MESPTLKTAILHNDLCLRHDTGAGHPESPQRYQAILKALQGADWSSRLSFQKTRSAEDEDLARCHAAAYIATAKRDIQAGKNQLSTGDTVVCEESLEPALHAAGGACAAVDAVMNKQAKNAFCLMRPPGHHARPMQGMGFCVFNNIAVAARYAQQQHQLEKVLIVDWDVHHGNGTQDCFYEDDSVFFLSTHQWPWYPGTGAKDDLGRGRGKGTTMNRPFPAGAGEKEILGVFRDELREAARRFHPDLVLVSAGFDSRIGDPLGNFKLSDNNFAELTQVMLELADELAEGRLVSLLEGGYNLQGLASAAASHCKTLAFHEK